MKYKIKKGLIFEKKGKKIIIFDSNSSTLMELNETASFIFEKIKRRTDTEIIIKLMVKKYWLPNKQALIDLGALLKKLKKEKIIN